MQLKIQRSQRAGGVLGNTVIFCLDIRADYSPDETRNIRRYKLGGQTIYNSRTAEQHLANTKSHLDRVDSDSLREKTAGLARGTLSLALAKMSLHVSVASLGRGHHIACKDMAELLEAEDTLRRACKDLTRYLDVAATFNGSELVIEYDKGEERIHITPNAPPLLEYRTETAPALAPPTEGYQTFTTPKWMLAVQSRWLGCERALIAYLAANGITANPHMVRAGALAVGILLVILLAAIL